MSGFSPKVVISNLYRLHEDVTMHHSRQDCSSNCSDFIPDDECCSVPHPKGQKRVHSCHFADDDITPLCANTACMDSPLTSEPYGAYSKYFKRRVSQAQTPHMSRLESSISISSLNSAMPHMEERMRRRLKYFFMNPCQKYQAKRRKPFKLAIQIMKIALVTAQLNLFGVNNQMLVDFKQENDEVFTTVFLGNNKSFYTKSAVYSKVSDIRKDYATWKNNTVGLFNYPFGDEDNFEDDLGENSPPPLMMCVESFTKTTNDSEIMNLTFDSRCTSCMMLRTWMDGIDNKSDASIPLSNGTHYHIDFVRLIALNLYMNLTTMQINTPKGFTSPTCFSINIAITLDNDAHTGNILPSLSSQYHMIHCSKERDRINNPMRVFLNFFDVFIMVVCLLSLGLCARSLWKAQVLRRKFEKFFHMQYNKQLTCSDRMEFFNMWYLLIIVSDILTILGSASKLILQNKYLGVVDYNICSVFLGVGCLCVWIGVLRYAGFFQEYNILVLTLKKSMPHVCRFMVCASLLYLGFLFCGWVVLGPHHHKFRNLVVTSEALFSLINGDDMYMTFEEMSKKSIAIAAFSQVYLYVFISLFIYVVLSLFIAVIMETYETIRQDRKETQQSDLEKFMATCTADASLENYGFDGLNTATRCCGCFGGDADDYESDENRLQE